MWKEKNMSHIGEQNVKLAGVSHLKYSAAHFSDPKMSFVDSRLMDIDKLIAEISYRTASSATAFVFDVFSLNRHVFAESAILYYQLSFVPSKTNFRFPFPFAAKKQKCAISVFCLRQSNGSCHFP
jgi:hypothetical protein